MPTREDSLSIRQEEIEADNRRVRREEEFVEEEREASAPATSEAIDLVAMDREFDDE